MQWWSPTTANNVPSPDERLALQVRLARVRAAVDLADRVEQDSIDMRAIWAMRTLQALAGVEEEVRAIREQLCRAAVEEGVSLRQVSRTAAVSHATVRTWTRAVVDPPAPDPSEPEPEPVASEPEPEPEPAGREDTVQSVADSSTASVSTIWPAVRDGQVSP